MDAPKKVPTIQDVARHAKVSAATVSRVLSSPERVSESTRERVTIAVRETGYTINQAARTLRMQRAKTILAAMPGIGNPFYSTILEAVVTTWPLRAATACWSPAGSATIRRAGWRTTIQSNRADGLLLFDGFLDTRKLHAITGDEHTDAARRGL